MKIVESICHSILTEREIPEENAIVVKELRKAFKELTVLDGVDFAVKRGTVLALPGPDNAGKATTINYH
jgi:ABC-2 type transport system ATP-binding protein